MVKAGKEIWAVVLAAGGSTRLGTPKQLLRFGIRSAVARAVCLAQSVAPGHVVVVVGAVEFRVRGAALRARGNVRIVTNARWREGMSRSLRVGLAALPPRAAAALLLVVDQPHVTAADLARLVAAWNRRPRRPAAAAYAGRLGIPAVLPRRCWVRVGKATGDAGARDVLRNPGSFTTPVSMPAGAFDVDTREDVAALEGGLNPYRPSSDPDRSGN